MRRTVCVVASALAALLLLAWLLRPRETTELPWSLRLFEPEPTAMWHPQDGTWMEWGGL